MRANYHINLSSTQGSTSRQIHQHLCKLPSKQNKKELVESLSGSTQLLLAPHFKLYFVASNKYTTACAIHFYQASFVCSYPYRLF